MKVDLNAILQYFIWEGLPSKFQDILVNILNKSYPDFQEINAKFLEASNRYQSQIKNYTRTSSHIRQDVSNFATSLNTSTKGIRTHNVECILLCGKNNSSVDANHNLSKCPVYESPNKKWERLKELNLCFKCMKQGHQANKCNFQSTGKCYKCGRFHWAFLCNLDKTRSFNLGNTSKKNFPVKVFKVILVKVVL